MGNMATFKIIGSAGRAITISGKTIVCFAVRKIVHQQCIVSIHVTNIVIENY